MQDEPNSVDLQQEAKELILKELEERENDLKFAVQVERAYLRKETQRMYQRLERAGLDTALVSQKLVGLKQRRGSV